MYSQGFMYPMLGTPSLEPHLIISEEHHMFVKKGKIMFKCAKRGPSTTLTCRPVLFNLFVIVEPLICFCVCQETPINKN